MFHHRPRLWPLLVSVSLALSTSLMLPNVVQAIVR
jgi:hypothetical protein